MRKNAIQPDRRIIIRFTETLPFLFFAGYIILAVCFYKARITYGDTGYYLFKMIQHENFNVESGRAISVCTQWIPLVFIKFSAPLEWVMIGYSVNIALFYLCCFLLTRYMFNSYFLAWGTVLCTHLLTHYGFYYCSPEVNIGAAYILLLVAFLAKPFLAYPVRTQIPVSMLLLAGVIVIHPFYFIVLLCITGLLFIDNPQKKYLLFIGLTLFFFLLKLTVLKSGYESGKLASIQLDKLSFRVINDSYLTFFLKQSFRERFFIAKYLFAAFLLLLLWKRKYLLAIALPAAFLSLYLFIFFLMPNGESLGYMEYYIMAISLVPLSVFLVYLQRNFSAYRSLFAILAFAVSVTGLIRIKEEPVYKERVDYLEAILKHGRETHTAKFFVEKKEVKHDKLLIGWALPYESLLLSTVNGKTQTIFLNNEQYNLEAINGKQLFLGTAWEQPLYQAALNKRYFNLDTTPYIRLNALGL